MTRTQVLYFAAIRPALALPEPFDLGPGERVVDVAEFIGVTVARLEAPAARLRVVAEENLKLLTEKIDKNGSNKIA